ARPGSARPAPGPVPRSGGEVVRILDAPDPIAALRELLDGISGAATVRQGQIALGAAQLMLLPIAQEHRGGAEVKELLDLVLDRWTSFPERSGFHAQEFLRNAFAAVGDDRERIARLTALVPMDASPELRFNVACALAVAGDRDAMVRAIESALAAGVSASQFSRDPDFDGFRDDPHFEAVLDRAAAPTIPVDVAPHLGTVRSALDSAVRTLREFGEVARLEPPAPLDAVLAAERVRKIQLPNDYRALLTICDGMTLWDHAFLGTVDYRNDTDLAKSARAYLEAAANAGTIGLDECVPLANWGQPNDWLLYDPHGRFRNGTPGYLLMLNADECPLDGLSHALDRFERIARDVFGTN
nr:SMI1/KNR4 family protein [Myxococcota bacterium]